MGDGKLKRLTAHQLMIIAQRKPVFEHAQALTGVPWQAIAAVWYRESFSVTPPKTPGGPFQFDPVPPRARLNELLKSYTKLDENERAALIGKGVNDFQAGTVFCACWLRHQSKANLSVDHSDAAIKDAFYGYNGRAWGANPDNSPYVANESDLKHDDMIIRGTIPDGHGGRKRIETIDGRPGAFAVYRQLIDSKI